MTLSQQQDAAAPEAQLITRLSLTALMLLTAGCGDLDGPTTPQTFRVVGAVVLVDQASIAYGGKGDQGFGCQGIGQFADLAPGATVVVTDSGGTRLAVGELRQGRMAVDRARMKPGGSAAGETRGCQLGFAVDGVPDLGEKWSLRVGTREFEFGRDEATNLRLSVG